MRLISSLGSSLSPELVFHILSYLDALALTQTRLVSAKWKELADSSSAWPLLCKKFWETKQNHPYERWVAVEEEEDSVEEVVRDQIEFLLLQSLMTGGGHSQETDASLILLKFIRLSSKKMAATPLSYWVRSQQIRLEHDLLSVSKTQEEKSRIRDEIVKNMQSSVQVNEPALDELQRKGVLLSWRESYIASVEDSSRTRITYEVCCSSLHFTSFHREFRSCDCRGIGLLFHTNLKRSVRFALSLVDAR